LDGSVKEREGMDRKRKRERVCPPATSRHKPFRRATSKHNKRLPVTKEALVAREGFFGV